MAMTTPARRPLTPLGIAVLLALAKKDLHGYALMQEIERQTHGALRLGTGSLRAALQRLEEDELVAAAPSGEDERRRYFGITPVGRLAG
jgi:DNA-binding PadR family transcriptional regulator